MDELRKGIAIGMLFGSGSGSGNLMEKTATENGVYTAAEEIDPETGEIFDPPKDGYSVFTVDLALDDKSVSITTSQITGSQTAEFEYDPHDENPELEGYSLFTIDLSAVKTDIEAMQQQIADAEACRQQVIAVLQQYDPDYDPDEGECPASKVDDLYDDYYEDEQTIADLQEQIEECNQCKADVIAKLQEYDPDFDPVTCSDIPPEIDKVVEEKEGYEFPEGTEYSDISELVKGDPLVDESVDAYPMTKIDYDAHQGSWYMSCGYVSNGEFVPLIGWVFGIDSSVEKPTVLYSKVLDPTTGYCEFKAQYLYGGSYRTQTLHATTQALIGYGESGHTYKVKNS